MRPKVRFSVFRRDGFTCGYCGKRPPEVVLEVDHIVPKSKGGTNDLVNLITACFACNRGKAAGPATEPSKRVKSPTASELAERRAQAEAYHEHLVAMREIEDAQLACVRSLWDKLLPKGVEYPESLSIRQFLRKLPEEMVLEAVDRASSVNVWSSDGPARYFYKTCHNMIADQQAARS